MAARKTAEEHEQDLQDAAETITIEPETEEVTVTADEEDEDDEPAVQQPNRKARRNKRLQELRAEDERKLAEERAQYEERIRNAEARAAYHEGLLAAQRQQAQPEDPIDAEIKRSERRQNELQTLWEKLTPEEQAARHAEMDGEYRKEREAHARAMVQRELRATGVRRQDPMEGYRNAMLQEHAGDIIQQPAHVQRWGIARLQQLWARGYPDDVETLKLAAEQTRQEFGLPSKVPSAKRQPSAPKTTLMGVRSSAGSAPRAQETQTIRIDEKARKLAIATFPKLAPEEAVKRWSRMMARKQREMGT